MRKLSLEELFDYYLCSLERLGLNVLDLSDGKIGYQIFEEFAVEYPASLSAYTLDLLEDNGIIDENIRILSKDLQDKLLRLNGSSSWSVSALRSDAEWEIVLHLSDKIKLLIHQKWSDEEISHLRDEGIK